jgi:hypothetical protein
VPDPNVAGGLLSGLALAARKAENVGERFPEEARRIHYDEAPARSIRGIASADETMELLEEGIIVLPAPVPTRTSFTDRRLVPRRQNQGLADGSKISTGAAKPLRLISPERMHWNGCRRHSFAAWREINIWPPRASPHKRAARLVTLPIAP